MNFRIGDIVRGNKFHINPERMSDKGFVADVREGHVLMIWFGSRYDAQVAFNNELELIWREPMGYLE